jgi:hypothetical protein
MLSKVMQSVVMYSAIVLSDIKLSVLTLNEGVDYIILKHRGQ